jgi:hypothetical protein
MKTHTTRILSAGTILAAVVVWVLAVVPHPPAHVAIAPVHQSAVVSAQTVLPLAPLVEISGLETNPPVCPDAVAVTQPLKSPKSAAPFHPATKVKPPVQDPAARAALSWVGADADAEQYWLAAISDPQLSDQEREDLMEDLNEEGLSDPQHPGPEDMPLIRNRLQLIEEIAPFADEFMLTHLGEAYKDLSHLLAGQAAP